jgi:hypothetical protein
MSYSNDRSAPLDELSERRQILETRQARQATHAANMPPNATPQRNRCFPMFGAPPP